MNEATLPLEFHVALKRAPAERRALETQRAALESTVSALAEIAADGILRHRTLLEQQMVEALLQGVHLSPLDQRRARMTAEAMRDIFTGTEWLNADQVGEQAAIGDLTGHGQEATPQGLTAAQRRAASARVNRWKHEGKLFALAREGRDWYPRYQFDALFRPLPVMPEILANFGAVAAMQVASWMESPNTYIAGKRPREVIEHAPQDVLAALAERQRGGLHG